MEMGPKGKPTIYRIYANAFEIAYQEEETADKFGGWTEVVRKNIDLFEDMKEMFRNKDNDLGKKKAILFLKHKKLSIRYAANEIIQRKDSNPLGFELVDRSHITL